MTLLKAVIEKFIVNFLAVFLGIQLARHWIAFAHWDFARTTLEMAGIAGIAVTLVDLWRYGKSV